MKFKLIHRTIGMLTWWKMLLLGLLTSLGMSACAESPAVRLRDQFHDQYQIRAAGVFDTIVSGSACAASQRSALANARQAAYYNLRTVIGNRRFSAEFQQLRSWEENGLFCAEFSAQARQP